MLTEYVRIAQERILLPSNLRPARPFQNIIFNNSSAPVKVGSAAAGSERVRIAVVIAFGRSLEDLPCLAAADGFVLLALVPHQLDKR